MNTGKFKIMWKNDEIVDVTLTPEEFEAHQDSNHVKRIFFRADEEITRGDIVDFLEEQIFDEHNARKDEILAGLGLDRYDVWDIAIKTRAISCRNRYWIKFEGDDLDYARDIETGRFLHLA